MARQPTWLTPFADEWKLYNDGVGPNWKRLAFELGMVKDALTAKGHSEEDARRIMFQHWREYLYRTPMAYVSPTRFRETFRYWSPTIRRRVDVDKQLDRELAEKEARQESRQDGGMQRIGEILEDKP